MVSFSSLGGAVRRQLLVLGFLLAFVACGDDETETNGTTSSSRSASTATGAGASSATVGPSSSSGPGGSGQGGSAQGGSAQGGSPQGGSSQGGSAQGGNSLGGAGGMSAGGMSAGGAGGIAGSGPGGQSQGGAGGAPPVCGNGVIETGEQCDDAGESATCDTDCTAAICGDGTFNMAAGEQCDDSNTTNGDGCSSTCQLEMMGNCPNQILPSVAPQTVTGNNSTGPSVDTGSCAGSGPELAYAWTAPSTGIFTFDTIGSSIDTVLYVRNGSCTGAELACNDDAIDADSAVAVSLTQGQTVIIFVDTFGTTGGAFTLHINLAPPCPAQTLPGVSPQTVMGNTVGGSLVDTGTCAGAGPDVSYSWTAPAAGTYTMSTSGTSFDTVLHVRDVNCSGAELACDDDSGPGTDSLLTVTLSAGQTVVIFADSYGAGGTYSLNISGP